MLKVNSFTLDEWDDIVIGGGKMTLIAGPCSIESAQMCVLMFVKSLI